MFNVTQKERKGEKEEDWKAERESGNAKAKPMDQEGLKNLLELKNMLLCVISFFCKFIRSVIAKASAASAATVQGHDCWLTDKEPLEHLCQSPGSPLALLEIQKASDQIGLTKNKG